jgi:hypothetical protein
MKNDTENWIFRVSERGVNRWMWGGADDVPLTTSALPLVTVATGTFYIGRITGLRYTSGSTGGALSPDGQFQYELIDGVEQPVTFSVAGIVLGATLGKKTVTPVDLATNGTVDSVEVINKTTLLRLLSDDPTSRVNVRIDQRLLDNAANFAWPQPDFTVLEFSTSPEVVQIVGDINAFLSTQKNVPTFTESQTYLKQRIYCAASGIYYGDIAGQDTGHIVFGINPITGGMTTLGWSDTGQNLIFIPQPASPEFTSTIRFSSGASLSGDNYDGVITNYTDAQGTWNNTVSQTSGTFTARHLDSSFSVKHHFSAAYIALFPVFGPGPAGTYSFNLYDDGTVVGTQVNIAFGDTTATAITGMWEGNVMTAKVDKGATINAILDFDNMMMVGQWTDPNAPITSGGISGTGCQLND